MIDLVTTLYVVTSRVYWKKAQICICNSQINIIESGMKRHCVIFIVEFQRVFIGICEATNVNIK